jgi:(E)-2-((N-methylformamido)methylene)succinate hydrolase
MVRQSAVTVLRAGRLQGQTAFFRCGAGDVVVLIHGVGMNAAIWRPQIEALAARHDVIAIDMLGHGGSMLPPEAPQLADYADQVVDLLDRLDIGRAALVGHSMGALVATQTALSHPARVHRLVAMNAVFHRPPDLKRSALARADELERDGFAASIGPTLDRWFGSPVPERLQAACELARQALKDVDPEGYRRTYRLFATSDEAFATSLSALAMPALFLTGTLDGNSTPDMSREMASLAPQGVFAELEGERHMMALTNPEAVNTHLVDFLAQVSQRDGEASDMRTAMRSLQ